MAKQLFTAQCPILQQRHNLAALRGHDVAEDPLRAANDGHRDAVRANVASAPAVRAQEREAPRGFQVTRQTGKHNVQGNGPPLGAEGWPDGAGLALRARQG